MAATQLQIYNIAMAALGERELDSLTEDREPRRIMDEIWNRGQGMPHYALEQGYWDFAMRTQKWDSSTTVTPEFGYTYAFEKPSDFVHLDMISADENFGYPLTDYEIEAGFFYAWVDPLYVRYVSDDSTYGNDLSLWPDTFTKWVGYYMAGEGAPRLKNDVDMEKLEKRINKALIDARSKDAKQGPVRFTPLSSWNQSRYSRYFNRHDRGNRGKLIG
jgi:hypothetical protein